MVNSRIYLNVPYSQKDEAKALGAKWDANKKRWYASNNLDDSLFKKWKQSASTAQVSKTKPSSKTVLGITTQPKDKNFSAYNGDQPPWN
ncbi:MAG: DUF5710 domain-containing protein [Methylococcales bacterium]